MPRWAGLRAEATEWLPRNWQVLQAPARDPAQLHGGTISALPRLCHALRNAVPGQKPRRPEAAGRDRGPPGGRRCPG